MTSEIEKFLIKWNKKFILAVPSGRNAYIKDGVVKEITDNSRAAFAIMAYIRENGGGTGVKDEFYDSLPNKEPF